MSGERLFPDDRQWIEDWREGMFSSSSRDAAGWPIEMHGVVESWEKCLDALSKIVDNAESWHGDDAAKGRALAVISRTAREAAERLQPTFESLPKG